MSGEQKKVSIKFDYQFTMLKTTGTESIPDGLLISKDSTMLKNTIYFVDSQYDEKNKSE